MENALLVVFVVAGVIIYRRFLSMRGVLPRFRGRLS